MITSEQGNAWVKLQPGWYYNNSVGNLVLSRSSQNSIICLWVCCLINLSMNNLLPPSFLTRLSNPVLPTPISHFIFSRSFYLSFSIPFPSWVLPTLHLPAFLPSYPTLWRSRCHICSLVLLPVSLCPAWVYILGANIRRYRRVMYRNCGNPGPHGPKESLGQYGWDK